MSLLAELNDLFVKYRIRPKKKLGQHFTIREEVIKELVELAELKSDDKVIEIGAGTGFLTRELASKCIVYAVECDEELCELLREELKGLNAFILCGDFLKLSLPEFNKIVSIPPYGISKKIMLKILKYNFECAIMVFQEEFAEKLTALPGFPSYSAITVFTQYKADIELKAKVSASSFFPKPKSDSVIVKITPLKKKTFLEDESLFYRFVAEIFRYRKKNLRNALMCGESFLISNFGLNYEKIERLLNGFDLDEKVDLTEVQTFLEMFKTIFYSCSQKQVLKKVRKKQ
ncbi:MAG: 16S rRNA (adenine(1518)-N(6)/adenine(1519)-N(6))-dimethyltransferase RsmA [Candidatus Diapherotrites archaeon]